MEKIRVVLADDHEIVRDGIKFLLESEGNIEVIGQASNGEEALKVVEDLKPDILITDIRMPVMNGLEAISELAKKNTAVKAIVLSMHDDEEYITQSIKAGASGYLLKDSSKHEFVKAIKTVQDGHNYYTGDVSEILVKGFLSANSLANSSAKPREVNQFSLTKREKQILSMLYNGMNNKEIAQKLDKSVRTVETHRFHIMKKLNVNNAIELLKKVESEEQLKNELSEFN